MSQEIIRAIILRDRINVVGEGEIVAEIILTAAIFLFPLYFRGENMEEYTNLLKKCAGNRNLRHRDVTCIDLTRVSFWDQHYTRGGLSGKIRKHLS